MGREMPVENDIDPDALRDIWDHCFLIQVRDLAQEDYNYTYLGDAIRESYRTGLSEADDAPIASPNAARLNEAYLHVIATRAPLIEEGEFTNYAGHLIKYRQCLLPLGENRHVLAILGGMRFKLFPTLQ